MAVKKVYIGSVGPFLYEDTSPINDPDGDFSGEDVKALATDGQMYVGEQVTVNTPPSEDEHVVRKVDMLGELSAVWPINSVFLSVVATNPATLLGFGTWVRIAEGQFLVGFKSGDADFDPVENAGGGKTHNHPVDVPATTSGGPSSNTAVDNNGDGTTTTVSRNVHTHSTDPASFNSGDNSALPPFFVVYMWKRTA